MVHNTLCTMHTKLNSDVTNSCPVSLFYKSVHFVYYTASPRLSDAMTSNPLGVYRAKSHSVSRQSPRNSCNRLTDISNNVPASCVRCVLHNVGLPRDAQPKLLSSLLISSTITLGESHKIRRISSRPSCGCLIRNGLSAGRFAPVHDLVTQQL